MADDNEPIDPMVVGWDPRADEVTGLAHHVMPSQFTEHTLASCVVHSQSLGWLPGVRMELHTADGAAIVGLFVGDALDDFADVVLDAVEAAYADLERARQNGVIGGP